MPVPFASIGRQLFFFRPSSLASDNHNDPSSSKSTHPLSHWQNAVQRIPLQFSFPLVLGPFQPNLRHSRFPSLLTDLSTNLSCFFANVIRVVCPQMHACLTWKCEISDDHTAGPRIAQNMTSVSFKLSLSCGLRGP
jgi:hypothetical protein